MERCLFLSFLSTGDFERDFDFEDFRWIRCGEPASDFEGELDFDVDFLEGDLDSDFRGGDRASDFEFVRGSGGDSDLDWDLFRSTFTGGELDLDFFSFPLFILLEVRSSELFSEDVSSSGVDLFSFPVSPEWVGGGDVVPSSCFFLVFV